MGTKQIQMEFQVVADDKISANVTITVGGVQKFSGALAHTVNVMPGQVSDDQTPYSLVTFDLEVANMPPLSSKGNPAVPSNGHGLWTTNLDVIIAVTGGSVCLQSTEANYTAVTPTPPDPKPTTGNSSDFVSMWFATQPVWTPTATGRLVIDDNSNSGPGSLLLLENESVAYQVAMSLYSA